MLALATWVPLASRELGLVVDKAWYQAFRPKVYGAVLRLWWLFLS